MGDGASSSGDDMVVGRTNESEERTILIATNGENAPIGYEADFVLNVEAAEELFTDHGVDGVRAKAFTVDGPNPAGSGVVGRGLNGIVGYPHAVPRDKALEADAQAGVFGMGGTNAAGVFGRGQTGVFGRGQNGVVGYEQTTERDNAARSFEGNEHAGVLGCGPTGVSGLSKVLGGGSGGPGVHGVGTPGIRGDGTDGNPGVSGDGGDGGGIGVLGQGHDGPAIFGISEGDHAGIFDSRLSHDGKRIEAQVSLIPINSVDPANPGRRISDPAQLTKADAGDLCVTITQDVSTNNRPIAALWFCTESAGPAGTPVWVKIA
jgi:hypothetical protein